MKKCLWCFSILFALCFAFAPVYIASAQADNVYIVSTKERFIEIARSINAGENTYISANIKLGADIAFDNDFVQINNFKGTFNGGGYSLKNIKQNIIAGGNYGVFGETDGATIKNLAVQTEISLADEAKSSLNIGGLVGYAKNTAVSNCKIETKIASDGAAYTNGNINIGFAFGHLDSCEVKNSYALGNAVLQHKGDSLTECNFGGLSGKVSSGRIYNCYVAPDIQTVEKYNDKYMGENITINKLGSADVSFGGIAGYAQGKNLEFRNIFFAGYLNENYSGNYGAIIGKISSNINYLPSSEKISNFKYLKVENSTTKVFDKAFGVNSALLTENTAVSQTTDFPKDESFFAYDKWYNLEYWNFETIWKNEQIYKGKSFFLPDLQQFYDYTIFLDESSKIYKLNFKGEDASVTKKAFKIDDEVEIEAKFNDGFENYFTFTNWQNFRKENVGDGASNLIFLCNQNSAGTYSINYVGKPVVVEISVVNDDGEVGEFGQIVYQNEKYSSLEFDAVYADESKSFSISAYENMETYKFSHFENGDKKINSSKLNFKLSNEDSRVNYLKVDLAEDGTLICKIKAVFSNNTSILNLNLFAGGEVKIGEKTISENSNEVFVNNKKYTLIASPKDNYKFDGWFDGETQISSELELADYSINSNSKLTAKFSKIEEKKENKINIWIIIGPCIGAVVLAGIIVLIVVKVKNKNKFNYKKNFKY